MGRISAIPQIEEKLGKPIREYLTEAIEGGKKPPEIAQDLEVSLSQIYELIKSTGLKEKLKEVSRKSYAGQSGELKSIIDQFLKDKEAASRSQRTIANYQDALLKFLWWLDQEKRAATLAEWNANSIRDFLHYLQTTDVRFGGKSTSARRPVKINTILAYRRIFRAFDYWMILQGIIKSSEVKKVSTPRREIRAPEDLPDELLTKILDAFDEDSFVGLRNKAIVSTFLYTGLRLDEMVNLNPEQIDLDSGRFQLIGKGNKQRLICLIPKNVELLRRYLKLREPLAKTPKLWITSEGTHFNRNSLRMMVKELNQLDPKLKRIHPHVFRHCWAYRLRRALLRESTMMKMGGWARMDELLLYSSAYSQEEAWKEGIEVIKAFQGGKAA